MKEHEPEPGDVMRDMGNKHYMFYCPGCKYYHVFDQRWSFNGDFKKPTFEPSLMVNRDYPDRCHSFVRNGRIEFQADSHHELKSQTVDLPPPFDPD